MKMVLLASLCIGVLGCANTNPDLPDPAKDFDCALTTKLFAASIEKMGGTEKDRQVLELAHDWFVIRNMQKEGGLNNLPSDDQVRKMYRTMGHDLPAAMAISKQCTDRMTNDPGFDSFVRTRGR